MEKLNLLQGSPEWHEFRRQGIGSSDITVLTGTNRYGMTPRKLYKEKVTGVSNKFVSEAMRRGSEQESYALEALRIEHPKLAPLCAKSSENPIFIASFDAIDDTIIVETKTPGDANLEKCLNGEIFEDWIEQLRWQMMVAGYKYGYLNIWDGAKPSLKKYERDIAWERKAQKLANEFWDMVLKGIEPPMLKGDYKELCDSHREDCLALYKQIDLEIKEREKRKDELKQQIVSGQEDNFILGDSKIFQTTTTSCDYKKMISDYQIQKEMYQKQSKAFWKIS